LLLLIATGVDARNAASDDRNIIGAPIIVYARPIPVSTRRPSKVGPPSVQIDGDKKP